MPELVYAVGDTVRLEVSFVSAANVEEVLAVFRWQETYARDDEGHRPVRNVSQSTISFEGSVEETEVAERRPYALPLKRYTAVLLSFVDKDHVLGSYQLNHLALRTASGQAIYVHPKPSDPVRSFRVAEETDGVQGVEVTFVEEPEEN